jgi:hypothetical protein
MIIGVISCRTGITSATVALATRAIWSWRVPALDYYLCIPKENFGNRFLNSLHNLDIKANISNNPIFEKNI